MIFWSRSYLCIYFPWNPLDFWRRQFIESVYVSLETLWIWIRQFIESVYVFPETHWILETPIFRSPYLYIYFLETLWILETPIHWKCICFPWNPLEFGYANIRSPYVYIHFPETLWILKTPIHWKPLSIRGPSIPLNSKALDFGALEILSPAHLVSLKSSRGCVMLWYSEVWG